MGCTKAVIAICRWDDAMTALKDDPRIDPRLRAMFGEWESPSAAFHARTREELLAFEKSAEGEAQATGMASFFESLDCEATAPSTGLSVDVEEFISSPDGNRIKVRITRPQSNVPLPCVCYLHGGGMQALSCFDGLYRAWARLIAAHGVAVAMIDFRNALRPSSAPEVLPYPAGLNDCVSGVAWLHAEAARLHLDPTRFIVAGDSGGGNLALATGMKLRQNGANGLIKGIYAMCPFIAGRWPDPRYPSSIEFDGMMLHSSGLNNGVVAYGLEAFEARDPMAWPGLATADDLIGLPPVVVSVNECDPLRDEGIHFYRLLLAAGVRARCRLTMGTTHGAEIFVTACPDISQSTARDLAGFALEAPAR